MGLRADPAPRADQLTRGLAVVTVMLSALFVAWLLATATAGPPAHVGTLTIVNETGLTVAVEAVGDDGNAQDLGVLEPTGPTARHEVADVGETWELVAFYGGEEVARTPRLTRARLDDDGWTVRIAPTAATTELRRAGYL